MKKVILALFALIILTGCTNINKISLDEIIDNGIKEEIKLNNEYRTGYKYYLPRGLNIVNQSDYNEKINNDRYTYYLYVDIISYYNNVKESFYPHKDNYYSKALTNKDKFGYVNIKTLNDKYLVEIMYNYAKIEVIVKKYDLNATVANAITILNSIQYNKSIIENVIGDNVLQFKETEMNIFDTKDTESNYLHYDEIYGQYDDSNEVHDSDLID